jgi:WD40 repeat protein
MPRTIFLALICLSHCMVVAGAAPMAGRKLFEVGPGQVAAVFSTDGKWLVTGGGEPDKSGDVKLWNVATGKVQATFTGHTDFVIAVAIAPDGKSVASAGWDKSVRWWDVATGKERANLGQHGKTVRCLAFSPDGRFLASGCANETVKLWDLKTVKLRETLKGTGGGSVAFSPDGKTLATGDDEWKPTVKLWDVGTLKEKFAFKGHTNRMAQAVFSPNGETLATISWDLTPHLWDVATGKLKAKLEKHKGSVECAAFSPDGRFLASACNWQRLFRDGPKGGISKVEDGSEVKVWDAATGRPLLTFEPDVVNGHGPRITALMFAGMGRSVITIDRSGTVKEWDVARLYE